LKNDKIYQLSNNKGLKVEFISLGGRLFSINIPEKDKTIDVLAGYDTVEQCTKGDEYMGAICGRFANRIGNGEFTLDGKRFQLAKNNFQNHLHGGTNGFHSKHWKVKEIPVKGYTSANELSVLSEDGDEGYPGNLEVTVIYALNENNELLIDLKAVTDKKTIVNLTSHPYFNLKGVGGGDALDHRLEINADFFTPIDATGIPTGELRPVCGTAMDFKTPGILTNQLNKGDQQVKLVNGLDHNWVLTKEVNALSFAARLTEPVSGRFVEMFTTQPGLQVFTAGHFDGSETGKGGYPILPYSAIALEAQNFPDAPNKPDFPDAVLNVGEVYHQQIIYRFGREIKQSD
jgi:aldose 1-epimerase